MQNENFEETLCPHCGATLNRKATFCRECGSDADTGLAEGAEFADLDLPDYEEILENELNLISTNKEKQHRKKRLVKAGITSLIAIILFSFLYTWF